MRIQSLTLRPYHIPMTTGQTRLGVLVNILDESGKRGWGDVAPLPNWSFETLDESIDQLKEKEKALLDIDWEAHTCIKELSQLSLYPSVTFGLESALLSLLAPTAAHSVASSALFMGSVEEIYEQARLRFSEGFTTAKLKVGNLSFNNAAKVIKELKDKFRLRIDVNRAWNNEDSLDFFSKYAKDAFDYVEEPFKNPQDLAKFEHPLAVDESYPSSLSLEQLEGLPTLKALIYKPTIQGGLSGCLPLQKWTSKRGVSLVLSSSFESDIGLAYIASMAHRLSLLAPIGIGTYYFMTEHLCSDMVGFTQGSLSVPALISPSLDQYTHLLSTRK